MTTYTVAPIPTDNLRVGDLITAETFYSYGPIVAIHPYKCSSQCRLCAAGVCPDRTGWRYARFANGVEVTMTPGAVWLPR